MPVRGHGRPARVGDGCLGSCTSQRARRPFPLEITFFITRGALARGYLSLTAACGTDTSRGMSLQTNVDNDIKDAMRAKDSAKLGVLRILKAALKNAAIEKGGADAIMEDQESVAVIRKQIKQRFDSIESYVKAGRPELAAAEQAEITILESYLPAGLSAEEILELVKLAIAEAGATSKQQMGAVMKIASAAAAGRADGKILSQEVQRQLS